MLSSFLLSVVSLLQQIKFEYIYTALGIYAIVIWLGYGIWLWKDTERRFSNPFVQSGVWLLGFVTFIPGLFIYLLVRPIPKDDDAYWIALEHKYLQYETRGMEECPVCSFMLRPEFQCCPSCGEVVREKCLVCENLIDVSWRICPYCGDEKWEEEEEIIPEKHSIFSGLRKWVRNIQVSLMKRLVKIYYNLRADAFSLEKKVAVQRKTIVQKIISQEPTTEKKEKPVKSRFIQSFKQLLVVEEKVPTKN